MGPKALGQIGACGYLSGRGYFELNSVYANEEDELRRTLAHEYMHYTQDYYMTVLLDNMFFTEAHAPLADRLVWPSTNELEIAECELTLKQAYTPKDGASSIFDLLSKSWDAASTLPIIEKFTVQTLDANVSSTFLHYMRSYRNGTKLNIVKLLTEHGWISGAFNWTWRAYLNNQTDSQLKTNLGDEFDDYVRFLLEGGEENFTLLDLKANIYSPIIANAHFSNSTPGIGTFARLLEYKFDKKTLTPKTEDVSVSIPYLAAKMVLLQNHDDYRGLAIEYKRKHTVNKDFKVYHGWYDVKTKTMKFIDISDSAKYNFMIQKKSLKFPEEFKEYAFLLIVNKKCPSVINLSSTFNASFDLTARPILDIESLEFLGFGDETLTTYVQLYDNGSNDQVFYFNGTKRYDNSVYTTYYSTEKKMLNDSVIRIDVENNYYYEHKLKLMSDGSNIGYAPPQRGNIRITQVIHYNIYKNTVKIEEIESGSTTIQNHKHPLRENTYVRTYLNSTWMERKEIEIELPEDIGMKSETNDDYTFKTHTSEETKSILLKVNHYVDHKNYTENGNMTHNISNLVSTDYSQGTVKIWGKFRAEKPELVIVSNP